MEAGTALPTGIPLDAMVAHDTNIMEAGIPTPTCTAAPEICDLKDNDCDGTIDNGVKNECGACGKLEHAKGESCSNGGQRSCAREGSYQCMGEVTVCSAPPPTPSPEVCDGIDNDCDGVADDGIVKNACLGCAALTNQKGSACSDGQGQCKVDGTWECMGTEQVVCTAKAKTPIAEVCDGIDNDCDGTVDEAVLNACGTCGLVPPEVCDSKDNDCDGLVDEGVKNACGVCGEEPPEICDGKDNDCDGIVDDGVKNACGLCGEDPTELCDGKDNDCDGVVDDGAKNECGGRCTSRLWTIRIGTSCTGDNPGECSKGSWICEPSPDGGPSPRCDAYKNVSKDEVCDGLDNDCDGVTDELPMCACDPTQPFDSEKWWC